MIYIHTHTYIIHSRHVYYTLYPLTSTYTYARPLTTSKYPRMNLLTPTHIHTPHLYIHIPTYIYIYNTINNSNKLSMIYEKRIIWLSHTLTPTHTHHTYIYTFTHTHTIAYAHTHLHILTPTHIYTHLHLHFSHNHNSGQYT